MNEQERNNLISKGKSVECAKTEICAYADGSISVEYATPKGVGGNWGDMFDYWPIIFLGTVPEECLSAIKAKIQDGTLDVNDLAGTKLEPFANCLLNGNKEKSETLSELFIDLLDFDLNDTNEVYAFQCQNTISFYNSLASLTIPFTQFCEDWGMIFWEDLSDEELEEWIERLDSMNDMQCSSWND